MFRIRKDYSVPKQFRLDSNDMIIKSLTRSGDFELSSARKDSELFAQGKTLC